MLRWFNLWYISYVRTSCSPCGLSRIILCVSIYLSVLHCKASSFFVEVNKCSKHDITNHIFDVYAAQI